MTTTASSITQAGLVESSARLLEPGTVLLAMYGSIGKLGIAGTEMATNQAIAFVRPERGIEARYLFWCLRSQRSALNSAGKGATQKNISQTILRGWPAIVPPTHEQRRIVAAIEEQFSRLDAAMAGLQRADIRLESARRTVRDTAFAGLPTQPVGALASTQLGKMLSAKARMGIGARPYLRNKNVQWGRIETTDLLVMDFSERDVERFSLVPGDVLVCEGGEVGRAAIWRGEIAGCCYQKALHRVRCGPELLPEFFVHAMRWLSDGGALERHVTGSTIKHLPQEGLRLVRLPAPSLDEQRRIVAEIEERLSVIDAMRAAIESAQRRSAALRRAILELAFRGELVPQDPSDEPASILLERIRAERSSQPSTPGRGRGARVPRAT